MGLGAVRACACLKLTTAFLVRTPSGNNLDGVLGPALLQPTAFFSLLSVHDFVCKHASLLPSPLSSRGSAARKRV